MIRLVDFFLSHFFLSSKLLIMIFSYPGVAFIRPNTHRILSRWSSPGRTPMFHVRYYSKCISFLKSDCEAPESRSYHIDFSSSWFLGFLVCSSHVSHFSHILITASPRHEPAYSRQANSSAFWLYCSLHCVDIAALLSSHLGITCPKNSPVVHSHVHFNSYCVNVWLIIDYTGQGLTFHQ